MVKVDEVEMLILSLLLLKRIPLTDMLLNVACRDEVQLPHVRAKTVMSIDHEQTYLLCS
jgi:hypothetical protein